MKEVPENHRIRMIPGRVEAPEGIPRSKHLESRLEASRRAQTISEARDAVSVKNHVDDYERVCTQLHALNRQQQEVLQSLQR